MSGEKTKVTTRAGRRIAVVFAVSFLLLAFVLLMTFRLAIGSRLMNGYLYGVARHTAVVLSLVGDSSEVESPEPYRGRESMVRASLDAWRRGGAAAPDAARSNGAVEALTSWEAWQYRAGQLRADIGAARKALEALGPPEPREVFSREEHVDVVRNRLAQLEVVPASSGEGGRASLAKPGLGAFVRASRAELDALAGGAGLDTQAFAARMSALATSIEAWRLEQRAFVEGRLDNLEAQQRERGPRVDFRYREGVGFRFELAPDCGALPVMAIYLAAVLAFPAAWRRRLAGVVLGLPVLYGVNVVRLASLAVLGAWDRGGEWYRFCHEYVWQGVYIGCVVVTWLLWLELVVKGRKKAREETEEGGAA